MWFDNGKSGEDDLRKTVCPGGSGTAMNRKYLVAIKVNADNGLVVEGNSSFDTDEPMTARHIEILKERYCSDVTASGIKCSPKKAVVYAVIPLDA
jgi:hypothetical protein